MPSCSRILVAAAVAGLLSALPATYAQDPAAADAKAANGSSIVRLSPKHEVWLDKEHKRVIIGGQIALRDGTLEMFACLKGTKEHESVVACNTEAYFVHAALLAVGAEVGTPVHFPSEEDPNYRPASGPIVDITVYWKEKGEVKRVRGQDWVRNIRTLKPLSHPWVFAGSGFWTDTDTGEKHYMAEGGDFICVSNFSSAMLDLPIESSQSGESLMFEAFVERIPPKGTKVKVVLTPRLDRAAAKAPESGPAG